MLSFFLYFLKSERAQIILAKSNNKVIAGSVFLFYDKFIHYFLNASDQDHKEKKANFLILWNRIRTYTGENYKVFDLGGTGRGSPLEVFKKGWGGKKYPIFEIRNFLDKGLKKSRLRDVFSILPSFLLEKVGSYFLKFKL